MTTDSARDAANALIARIEHSLTNHPPTCAAVLDAIEEIRAYGGQLVAEVPPGGPA